MCNCTLKTPLCQWEKQNSFLRYKYIIISVKTNIDLERIFSIVINAHPEIFHNYLKRIFIKAIDEPMYGYNKSIQVYLWQTLFAFAEVLSFISFAASVVVGA